MEYYNNKTSAVEMLFVAEAHSAISSLVVYQHQAVPGIDNYLFN